MTNNPTFTKFRFHSIEFSTLHKMTLKNKLNITVSPFDELVFHLKTGETVAAVCADVSSCNAHFVLKNCYWKGRISEDIYYCSAARAYILSKIYFVLSEDLQIILSPRKIKEDRIRYSDKFWMPSAIDIFGSIYEGENLNNLQLPIFKELSNRIKYDENNQPCWQWLRTPSANATAALRYKPKG